MEPDRRQNMAIRMLMPPLSPVLGISLALFPLPPEELPGVYIIPYSEKCVVVKQTHFTPLTPTMDEFSTSAFLSELTVTTLTVPFDVSISAGMGIITVQEPKSVTAFPFSSVRVIS